MHIGYIAGVFDLLHCGHIHIIERAKKHCDKLIIGIHPDKFVKEYKRTPNQNTETRKQKLNETFPGCNVIIAKDANHRPIIEKFKINTIYHGNDWEEESYKKQIKYYETGLDKLGVKLYFFSYSNGISTTEIMNNSYHNYNKYKTFLFDLDNTLIINDKATPFAAECIKILKKRGKTIKVVTNNNRYNPSIISEILNEVDIPIDPNHIFSSLLFVLNYLTSKYNKKRIYVWGTEESIDWLKKKGVNIVDSNPECVVILYRNDFDYMSLVTLCKMCKLTPFICGNVDFTYPDLVDVLPDTGSVTQLVKSCVKKEPEYICDKTNPEFMKELDTTGAVMIGDSLLTDKVFAENKNIPFIRIGDNADISHLGIISDILKYM